MLLWYILRDLIVLQNDVYSSFSLLIDFVMLKSLYNDGIHVHNAQSQLIKGF